MSFNIAIDGPAGAGKSTIARRAARELGFIYVDTGAMYRAIALGLLRRGTDVEAEQELMDALAGIEVSIGYEGEEQQVFLNGENVSGLIRTEEVSAMARREDVLMDGRDIGTMILPHAQLKIYLTASVATRASRRYKELQAHGQDCTLEEIIKDIEARDYRDMHRETAPLCQAEDAVLVDSSDMTIEEVVEQIVTLTRERMESHTEG